MQFVYHESNILLNKYKFKILTIGCLLMKLLIVCQYLSKVNRSLYLVPYIKVWKRAKDILLDVFWCSLY